MVETSKKHEAFRTVRSYINMPQNTWPGPLLVSGEWDFEIYYPFLPPLQLSSSHYVFSYAGPFFSCFYYEQCLPAVKIAYISLQLTHSYNSPHARGEITGEESYDTSFNKFFSPTLHSSTLFSVPKSLRPARCAFHPGSTDIPHPRPSTWLFKNGQT